MKLLERERRGTERNAEQLLLQQLQQCQEMEWLSRVYIGMQLCSCIVTTVLVAVHVYIYVCMCLKMWCK